MKEFWVDSSWADIMTRAPRMTVRDEQTCARIIQRRGPATYRAREKLLEANVRFFITYSAGWSNRGVRMTDLLAISLSGAWESTETYKPVNVKFISYAVYMAKIGIQREIATSSTPVAVPLNSACKTYGFTKAREAIEQSVVGTPDIAEVTESLGYSKFYGTAQKILSATHLSLNKKRRCKHGGDSETEWIDLLEDDVETDKVSLDLCNRLMVDSVLEELPVRSRTIIRSFFGIDGTNEKNLEEIGRDLGLSRERIRQIKLDIINMVLTKKKFKWIREAME